MPPCHLRLARLGPVRKSGAATFVVTTNNDTIIQPAEDSISNTCSIGVTPTTRFGLQTSPVRFKY